MALEISGTVALVLVPWCLTSLVLGALEEIVSLWLPPRLAYIPVDYTALCQEKIAIHRQLQQGKGGREKLTRGRSLRGSRGWLTWGNDGSDWRRPTSHE